MAATDSASHNDPSKEELEAEFDPNDKGLLILFFISFIYRI